MSASSPRPDSSLRALQTQSLFFRSCAEATNCPSRICHSRLFVTRETSFDARSQTLSPAQFKRQSRNFGSKIAPISSRDPLAAPTLAAERLSPRSR